MKHMNSFSYNISHSGRWVVIAYGRNEVGIDIEEIQRGNENIADRFFTEDEKNYIRVVTKEKQAERFTQIWTLKESYIKYLGTGFSTNLNLFSVNAADGVVTNQNGEIQQDIKLKSYEFNTYYYLSVCSMEEDVTIHEIMLEDLVQFIKENANLLCWASRVSSGVTTDIRKPPVIL